MDDLDAKQVLMAVIRELNDQGVTLSRAVSGMIGKVNFTPSEEDLKKANEEMAAAVSRMNAGYLEAKLLSDTYGLELKIDFVQLNYGGVLTYTGDPSGYEGYWNSSNVNNPC